MAAVRTMNGTTCFETISPNVLIHLGAGKPQRVFDVPIIPLCHACVQVVTYPDIVHAREAKANGKKFEGGWFAQGWISTGAKFRAVVIKKCFRDDRRCNNLGRGREEGSNAGLDCAGS